MCNRSSSGPQNVVIVSFMSRPVPRHVRASGTPAESPSPLTWNHYAEGHARGPQDQPGTDGGGDCRAGCRMDPGGRTGSLGNPRRPGRAQTQGPRRRAHLEHVPHHASPSDESRSVAHAPGPRDRAVQGDGLDPRGRAVLPGAAHRGGAGPVGQRRQTEHGPAHGSTYSGRHRPGDQWRLADPVRHGPDRRGRRAPLRARRRRRTPPRDDDRARRGHAVPGPGAADAAGDDGSGNRPGSDRDHRLHRQNRALLLHAGVARRRRGGPGPRRSRPPPGPRKERPHHHAGERRQARRTGHLRALRAGRGAQPALPVGR